MDIDESRPAQLPPEIDPARRVVVQTVHQEDGRRIRGRRRASFFEMAEYGVKDEGRAEKQGGPGRLKPEFSNLARTDRRTWNIFARRVAELVPIGEP